MKKPEEWSDGTYFIVGMVIGALGDFLWLGFTPASFGHKD